MIRLLAASVSALMPVILPNTPSNVPKFAAQSSPVFTAPRYRAESMLYPFCRYSSKLFLNPTTLYPVLKPSRLLPVASVVPAATPAETAL